MACVHLQQLYSLCEEHDLKLSASDLIRVVCHQCGEQEVCPSMLTDEYDAKQAQKEGRGPSLSDSESNATGADR